MALSILPGHYSAQNRNMPCQLAPGAMVSNECSVVLPEDVRGWKSSIENYIKTTQAKCLDIRTIPLKELRSENLNIGTVFDSLIGSEITQIFIGKEISKPLTSLNHDFNSLDIQADEWQRLIEVLPKTKVEKLSIVNCKLGTDNILRLLEVLKDTQVTDLDISENFMRLEKSQANDFVFHVGNSSLKSLHISGDRMASFKEVTDLFWRLFLTGITRIVLSNFFKNGLQLRFCKHYEMHLHDFVTGLRFSNLTELDLEGNTRHWNYILGDFLAEALEEALPTTSLKKLSLRGTGISDRGIDFLVRGVVNSKITSLNLSDNLINGYNKLVENLKHAKVTKLDLKGNKIKNNGMFSGVNILQGSSLNVLNLRSCFDRTNPLPMSLLSSLKFSELISLDLSSNRLGLLQCTALADMLVDSKLSHLNLSKNRLCGESFSILGESFKKSNLKHIGLDGTLGSLSQNILGVDSFLSNMKDTAIITVTLRYNSLYGTFVLFAPILGNKNIVVLDLSYNRCSKVILKRAWQLNLLTSLIVLNLAHADIGDKEVEMLALYLPETQIIILRLSNNKITCHGATALASFLKQTKLRYLDLRENEIEAAGTESLNENLKNTCITYLNVSPKPKRTLSPAMRRNLLLIDTNLWENRKRVEQFAELLKKSKVFNTDRDIVMFRHGLDQNAVNDLILNCLKLHKIVSTEPFILRAIEQDKCILDLENQECLKYSYDKYTRDYNVHIFIEDCDLIHNIIHNHLSFIQDATQRTLQRSFLRFLLGKLRNFLNLTGEDAETDVSQLVSEPEGYDGVLISEIIDLLPLYHTIQLIGESLDIT